MFITLLFLEFFRFFLIHTNLLCVFLHFFIKYIFYVKAIHPNAEELFNVTSDLREICNKLQNDNTIEKPGVQIFYHVKPMLLERCKIEDVGNLFHDQRLKYFLQEKYDGERSQIHMKDGRFKFFTRMGYDITSNTLYGESSNSGKII